ncbi:MAG: glycine C-acetyltransferase [Planctomycetota bacterium]
MKRLDDILRGQVEALGNAGTLKVLRHLTGPMDAEVPMEGHGNVLVLSSNNYLGLANHPEVIAAGIAGLKKYGAGTASVRFICGTLDVHRELEAKIAGFLGTEAALTYVSCWNANEGVIPTLALENSLILSDELNHASIIDAGRLAGKTVTRQVYRHSDMADLETKLRGCPADVLNLVVTDGVFSMEGDLARLPEIIPLAAKYHAAVILDDSHGIGVLGKTGRGTAEHFGLHGKVDVITGTLGKSLGGAAGGFVAASRPVVDFLVQRSRPQLFSNALPATVAASALAAVGVLEREPERVRRLHESVCYFRDALKRMGYTPLEGESAIIPIIVGETATAIRVSDQLLKKGVFVTGFGFPVVPEGKARLRVQISAAHERRHLDRALAAFAEVRNDACKIS